MVAVFSLEVIILLHATVGNEDVRKERAPLVCVISPVKVVSMSSYV
jgi:hypothetical protein